MTYTHASFQLTVPQPACLMTSTMNEDSSICNSWDYSQGNLQVWATMAASGINRLDAFTTSTPPCGAAMLDAAARPSATPTNLSVPACQDSLTIFAPNFGHVTIGTSTPPQNTVQSSLAVPFSEYINCGLAGADPSDGHGNTVITILHKNSLTRAPFKCLIRKGNAVRLTCWRTRRLSFWYEMKLDHRPTVLQCCSLLSKIQSLAREPFTSWSVGGGPVLVERAHPLRVPAADALLPFIGEWRPGTNRNQIDRAVLRSIQEHAL